MESFLSTVKESLIAASSESQHKIQSYFCDQIFGQNITYEMIPTLSEERMVFMFPLSEPPSPDTIITKWPILVYTQNPIATTRKLMLEIGNLVLNRQLLKQLNTIFGVVSISWGQRSLIIINFSIPSILNYTNTIPGVMPAPFHIMFFLVRGFQTPTFRNLQEFKATLLYWLQNWPENNAPENRFLRPTQTITAVNQKLKQVTGPLQCCNHLPR